MGSTALLLSHNIPCDMEHRNISNRSKQLPLLLKMRKHENYNFHKRLISLNAMSPKVILLPTLFLLLLSFKDLYWFGAWEQIEYFQQIYWNNQSNLILLHDNTETQSNLKLTKQRGIWWKYCSREGLPSPSTIKERLMPEQKHSF